MTRERKSKVSAQMPGMPADNEYDGYEGPIEGPFMGDAQPASMPAGIKEGCSLMIDGISEGSSVDPPAPKY